MSKTKKIKPEAYLNRITRLEFSATHCFEQQFPSDMFYVGLANKIYPLLHEFFSGQTGFTTKVIKRTAIMLACYVEDLVAGSGVWAAFTSLCRKKYGNLLPFYNLRETTPFCSYDDETPSFHAVLFMLWYVADSVNPGTVTNPENPALRMLAISLLPDLLEAYDKAPETPARPILLPEEEIGIPLFYQIRNLCTWLCHGCYLTCINDYEKVTKDFEDFLNNAFREGISDDEDRQEYAIGSFVPMNALIGPLAIPAYEWLAEIVSLYPEPEEEKYIPVLEAIKSRPYTYYRYVTVGESELTLEDINGERLTLSASTMPGGKFPPEVIPGKSALMSLVLLDGVWLLNGIGLLVLPEEVFEKYRKLHSDRMKNNKIAFSHLKKRFGGNRIGVCGSYEEYLKLVFGDEAPKKKDDSQMPDDILDADNLLYFLNTDGDVSMLPDMGAFVKIKDNPYYDKENASQGALALVFDHSLSTPEMREYIIKHKLIPDAALNSAISPEHGKELFQKNIRFFNDYSSRDTMRFLMED